MAKFDRNKKTFIDDVLAWAYRGLESNSFEEVDKWPDFVRLYLKRRKWGKTAIEDFIEMGNGGFNYSLLHIKTSLHDFYGEVEYCSDRMSMDRLLRCHIQYQTLDRGDNTVTED